MRSVVGPTTRMLAKRALACPDGVSSASVTSLAEVAGVVSKGSWLMVPTCSTPGRPSRRSSITAEGVRLGAGRVAR